MCNRVDNFGISIEKISEELNAEEAEEKYYSATEVNAFDRPALPVILDHHGRKITHATWGLSKEIPKDRPALGINLMAEKANTLYKNYLSNRCVIPVSGFYDWMHVSNPGKKTPLKVKHRMHWKEANHFYLAGLFDVWDNNEIGFGIVTTQANVLMTVIHNSKHRMPICMNREMAHRFLNEEPIENFIYPTFDPALTADNLEPEKMPLTLF